MYVTVAFLELFQPSDILTDPQPFTVDPRLQTRSSSEEFIQQSIVQGAPLTIYPLTQALQVIFKD